LDEIGIGENEKMEAGRVGEWVKNRGFRIEKSI
jgi:hypothetical protein